MPTKNNFKQKCLKAAAMIVMGVVAGCAPAHRQVASVDWVAPGEHQVVCDAAEFRDTTPVRVKFSDIWQEEEYALYKAEGSQLEVIFAKVNRAHNVSLDYQMSIAEMVATWNNNAKKNLEWGQAGRLDIRPGTWFYRTYAHTDTRRSCAGFFVEWDAIFEDPKTRPAKLLLGYYCVDGTEGLDEQQVRRLIGGIGILLQDDSFTPGETAPGKAENPSALAAAKGDGPNSDTGNPGFPFMFARPFTESGGGKYK